MSSTELVHRVDSGTFTVERIDGKFLRGRVRFAKTGVLKYLQRDGKIQNEVVLPGELFSEATKQSASGMPVTDGHPPELVTPDNWRKYGRGSLGDDVRIDGIYLSAGEIVNDGGLIADLKVGEKIQVSVGKTLKLDRTPGVFEGERYDAIQRDIVFNHLAHVEAGRAGDTVRLYLDSVGGGYAEQQGDQSMTGTEPKQKDMDKTLSFRDRETKTDIHADVPTHVILMGLDKKVQELKKDAEASKEEKEKLEQELKASKEKEGKEGEGKSETSEIIEEKAKKLPFWGATMEKMKALTLQYEEMRVAVKELSSPKKVQALADARIKLIADAQKTLGADADLTKLDDAEIMRQVIKGTLKDVNVSDMSDEYLAIYYDAAAKVQDAKPKDPVSTNGARRIDEAYIADQRKTLANMHNKPEAK